MKIAVFKKDCKIHRKTPVPESFLNKTAGLTLQLYQKETLTLIISCVYCDKNTLFYITHPVADSVHDLIALCLITI